MTRHDGHYYGHGRNLTKDEHYEGETAFRTLPACSCGLMSMNRTTSSAPILDLGYSNSVYAVT